MSARTVLKYRLTEDTTIDTYADIRWLSVSTQRGEPHVWAEVNMNNDECLKRVVVVPTGGVVPAEGVYLGTAHDVDGWMVVHAYEVPR